MLTNVPPQFRKRRGQRRTKSSAPPPPPLGLLITSVTISIGAQIIVHFSGAIVWNGIDLPYAFQAFTQDGFFDVPVGVIGAGADWIELEFNAGCDPGAAWQLVGPMAGITPEVAWPQSGVVL